MRYSFMILLVTLSVHSIAQVWIKEPGEGYAQLGFSYITANRIYDYGPELQLRRVITDVTLQGYVETGIAEKWMLSAILEARSVSTGDQLYDSAYVADTLPSGSLFAPGNTSINFIHGFITDKPLKLSGKIGFVLNTAKQVDSLGLATGTKCLGSRLGMGLAYSKNKLFTSWETSVVYRSNNYSTQLDLHGQVGYQVTSKFISIVTVDMVQSFRNNVRDDGNLIHTGLYLNNQEFISYSLKLGYGTDWMVWVAAAGGVIGYAVPRAPAFSVAVARKWSK